MSNNINQKNKIYEKFEQNVKLPYQNIGEMYSLDNFQNSIHYNCYLNGMIDNDLYVDNQINFNKDKKVGPKSSDGQHVIDGQNGYKFWDDSEGYPQIKRKEILDIQQSVSEKTIDTSNPILFVASIDEKSIIAAKRNGTFIQKDVDFQNSDFKFTEEIYCDGNSVNLKCKYTSKQSGIYFGGVGGIYTIHQTPSGNEYMINAVKDEEGDNVTKDTETVTAIAFDDETKRMLFCVGNVLFMGKLVNGVMYNIERIFNVDDNDEIKHIDFLTHVEDSINEDNDIILVFRSGKIMTSGYGTILTGKSYGTITGNSKTHSGGSIVFNGELIVSIGNKAYKIFRETDETSAEEYLSVDADIKGLFEYNEQIYAFTSSDIFKHSGDTVIGQSILDNFDTDEKGIINSAEIVDGVKLIGTDNGLWYENRGDFESISSYEYSDISCRDMFVVKKEDQNDIYVHGKVLNDGVLVDNVFAGNIKFDREIIEGSCYVSPIDGFPEGYILNQYSENVTYAYVSGNSIGIYSVNNGVHELLTSISETNPVLHGFVKINDTVYLISDKYMYDINGDRQDDVYIYKYSSFVNALDNQSIIDCSIINNDEEKESVRCAILTNEKILLMDFNVGQSTDTVVFYGDVSSDSSCNVLFNRYNTLYTYDSENKILSSFDVQNESEVISTFNHIKDMYSIGKPIFEFSGTDDEKAISSMTTMTYLVQDGGTSWVKSKISAYEYTTETATDTSISGMCVQYNNYIEQNDNALNINEDVKVNTIYTYNGKELNINSYIGEDYIIQKLIDNPFVFKTDDKFTRKTLSYTNNIKNVVPLGYSAVTDNESGSSSSTTTTWDGYVETITTQPMSVEISDVMLVNDGSIYKVTNVFSRNHSVKTHSFEATYEEEGEEIDIPDEYVESADMEIHQFIGSFNNGYISHRASSTKLTDFGSDNEFITTNETYIVSYGSSSKIRIASFDEDKNIGNVSEISDINIDNVTGILLDSTEQTKLFIYAGDTVCTYIIETYTEKNEEDEIEQYSLTMNGCDIYRPYYTDEDEEKETQLRNFSVNKYGEKGLYLHVLEKIVLLNEEGVDVETIRDIEDDIGIIAITDNGQFRISECTCSLVGSDHTIEDLTNLYSFGKASNDDEYWFVKDTTDTRKYINILKKDEKGDLRIYTCNDEFGHVIRNMFFGSFELDEENNLINSFEGLYCGSEKLYDVSYDGNLTEHEIDDNTSITLVYNTQDTIDIQQDVKYIVYTNGGISYIANYTNNTYDFNIQSQSIDFEDINGLNFQRFIIPYNDSTTAYQATNSSGQMVLVRIDSAELALQNERYSDNIIKYPGNHNGQNKVKYKLLITEDKGNVFKLSLQNGNRKCVDINDGNAKVIKIIGIPASDVIWYDYNEGLYHIFYKDGSNIEILTFNECEDGIYFSNTSSSLDKNAKRVLKNSGDSFIILGERDGKYSAYNYVYQKQDGIEEDYCYSIMDSNKPIKDIFKYGDTVIITDGNVVRRGVGGIDYFEEWFHIANGKTISNIFVKNMFDVLMTTDGGNNFITRQIYSIKTDYQKFTERDAISVFNSLSNEISSQISNEISSHIDEYHYQNSIADTLTKYSSVDFQINDGFMKKTSSGNDTIISNDYIDRMFTGKNTDNNFRYVTVNVKNSLLNNWMEQKCEYIVKHYKSGISEMYIYIPSTNTYYIPHIKGTPNCEYEADEVTVNGRKIHPNIHENYTQIKVGILSSYFYISDIYDQQIKGQSLPLKIKRESSQQITLQENDASRMFHTFVEPSVAQYYANPDDISVINDQYMLNYYCFGSDAQAIRLTFRDDKNNFDKKYKVVYYHGNGLKTSSGKDFVAQIILQGETKRMYDKGIFNTYEDTIFIGWDIKPGLTARYTIDDSVGYSSGGNLNLSSMNTVHLYAIHTRYNWAQEGYTEIEFTSTAENDTANIHNMTIDPESKPQIQNNVLVDWDGE